MANFRQKFLLLKGLLNGKRSYAGPFYVCVDITRNCNLHCFGCYAHDPDSQRSHPGNQSIKNIPFPLVQRLAGQLQKMGVRKISLSGDGEPLLHPDIFDIIAAFKNAGMTVQMFTNGTLLGKEKAQALIDSGVDILKVSLWGSTSEEYAKCHLGAAPSAFEDILESLSYLSQLKKQKNKQSPIILIHHVLNKSTYKNTGRKIELARACGCNGVMFYPFICNDDAHASETLAAGEINTLCASLAMQKKEMDAHFMLHNIDDALLHYRLGKSAWLAIPCYAAWYQARIRIDGSVSPCVRSDTSFGNLSENSFAEIWKGISCNAFRKKCIGSDRLRFPERCNRCDWCCTLQDNYRIHRLFKWFSPFFSL
jgi:MoaA/NifB/PqqE/SkfB family radical SAM enzyme